MDALSQSLSVDGVMGRVEQVLLTGGLVQQSGSDPDPSVIFGSDRNVCPHFLAADLERSDAGYVDCAVAGLVYRQTYYWSDHPELPIHCGRRRLKLAGVSGISARLSRQPWRPSDIQPGPVSRLAAALEMASPRILGPEWTLSNIHLQRQESESGRVTRYGDQRPGSALVVCSVVCEHANQFRVRDYSLPETGVHRGDLSLSDDGREVLSCNYTWKELSDEMYSHLGCFGEPYRNTPEGNRLWAAHFGPTSSVQPVVVQPILEAPF